MKSRKVAVAAKPEIRVSPAEHLAFEVSRAECRLEEAHAALVAKIAASPESALYEIRWMETPAQRLNEYAMAAAYFRAIEAYACRESVAMSVAAEVMRDELAESLIREGAERSTSMFSNAAFSAQREAKREVYQKVASFARMAKREEERS